jgi:hypothetical protein
MGWGRTRFLILGLAGLFRICVVSAAESEIEIPVEKFVLDMSNATAAEVQGAA